ncbi:MAG: oxidoreductase [Gordonia sp.]|jgi:glucose-6-phosphate dehydrogenase assembly protein OpcA|uniref:Glucose-6-phosphate dehydrogenase assembly protein OpcA n=1 Tax=Gordonia rubripertincta TaxID=36822 RepID=A0ABT4MUB9_GORRU|nr:MULTISPECIES: glucose-6-phosphate dehydrogenase assembly protein OpcA [Mycobacteriales]MBA4020761.1 oxidoreductase [Gordonia sp. (in: high G+C Gram-positive bacteria)]MCZ4550593.1 glucose-6-phosphate dehydrogenase assembly protein OpcA [Gordonia rubripertincta]OZG28485.1 oxidoreductase [Williamsia sp. 1138]
MIVELPDTSTTAISKQLIKIRDSGGAFTSGRVLTLLVCTDEGEPTEGAIEAANEASREHPCRVIVVARGDRNAQSRLDAQIRVGGDAGASEVVVLHLYGDMADHGESVVIPFMLPDTPVVTWWPGRGPDNPAADPIGRLGTRRITDARRATDVPAELQQRLATYAPGDSDIAWSRITAWRALLASALDQPPHSPVTAAEVEGPADSPAVDLLAGWLHSVLDVPVTRSVGSFKVTVEREAGPLVLCVGMSNQAIISIPGKPDGRVALPGRELSNLLAEELRRLDPDEIYHLALQGVAGIIRAEDRVHA